MKCKHCGEEIANDSQFCEYCGKSISANNDKSQQKKLQIIISGIALLVCCVGTTLFFAIRYHEMAKNLKDSKGEEDTHSVMSAVDTLIVKDTIAVSKGFLAISADKMNVLYAGISNPVSVYGSVSPDKIGLSFPGCNFTTQGGGKYIVNVPTSLIGRTVTATAVTKSGDEGSTTFCVKRVPDPKAVLGTNIRGGKRAKADLLANPVLRATMSDDFVYDLKWSVSSFRVIIVSRGMEEPAIDCQGSALNDKAKAAIQKASSNTVVFFTDIKATSQAGERTLDEFSVRIK